MSKHSKIILSLLSISFFILPQTTRAVEFKVLESGAIEVYEDRVLGKSTSSRITNHLKIDRFKAVPSKILPARKNQVIEIEPHQNQTKSTVRIRQRLKEPTTDKQIKGQKQNLQQIQQLEAERVGIETEFSDQQTDKKINLSLHSSKNLSNKTKTNDSNKKTDSNQSGSEVVLETDGVRARLDSTVTLDKNKEQIIITTPSGNVHVLKHLPTQAVQVLREHNKLTTFAPEFEIKTDDKGDVFYTAEVEHEAKLLGIFKRRVKKRLSLNDKTGEIKETAPERQTPVEKLLDKLSF